MSNTVRVAASASVACLAALFALPLYIIAFGWLVMSMPEAKKNDIQPIAQDYTVQVPDAPASFVNPQARDEKKFEAFGDCITCDQTQRTGWRLFRRQTPQVTQPTWQPQPQPLPESTSTPPPAPTPTGSAPPKPSMPDPEKAFAEKKTGAGLCECCKKPMIGPQQVTYWAGYQPLTYICTTCEAKTPKQEREKIMERWLDRVAPTLAPTIKAQYMAAVR